MIQQKQHRGIGQNKLAKGKEPKLFIRNKYRYKGSHLFLPSGISDKHKTGSCHNIHTKDL